MTVKFSPSGNAGLTKHFSTMRSAYNARAKTRVGGSSIIIGVLQSGALEIGDGISATKPSLASMLVVIMKANDGKIG